MARNLIWVSLFILIAGCAVNPVTGERELAFVSEAQEIAIGQEQYVPAQQMQGGAYRTDEALTEYVNRVGQKIAQYSGRDLPYEFVVLNHSVPNAWALPGGKIAINRGLLTELKSEAELAAVLGHEIAHAAARHGAKRVERGYITQGLLLGTAIYAQGQEFGGAIVQGAALAAGLVGQKYSRDAGREADYYGTRFMAQAGYDPNAAVTLQETFVRLSGNKRSDFLQGLFASHPPSQERVANNRRLVRELENEGLGGGGQFVEPFELALADVRAAAPAFAAYDEANKRYADDDYEAAASSINRALNLRSKEAVFHGMRGAIRLQQDRFDDAITNFDRAIRRDDQYFVYWLQRGLAHAEQSDNVSARSDLEQSIRWLPTSTAYQALGELAESDGDREAAKRYYARAGQAAGSAGHAARASLVRLDLPDNPDRYVNIRTARDESGRYLVQVQNASPVPLHAIELGTEAMIGGQLARSRIRIGSLDSGASVTRGLDLQAATAIRVFLTNASVSR